MNDLKKIDLEYLYSGIRNYGNQIYVMAFSIF